MTPFKEKSSRSWKRPGPTPKDKVDLRRLFDAAGDNAEFQHWLQLALQEKKGTAGSKDLDKPRRLVAVGLQCALAARHGVAPRQTVKQFFEQAERQMEAVDPGSFKRLGFGKDADGRSNGFGENCESSQKMTGARLIRQPTKY
jgi:hypothetical protein